MSPGLVFERVYLALKAELGSGRRGAGAPLEPAHLSQALNASITPVRDALHRLVGEGLVEAPRGDGFRTPAITELGLRQLYRWHATLLDVAARSPSTSPPSSTNQPLPGPGDDPLDRTELQFLAIAGRAGNDEHLAAIARLGERLRPARRVEQRLLDDVAAELDDLAAAQRHDDAAALRRAILLYHRRRERLTPEIVQALHRPA